MLKYILLGFLKYRPMTGYELKTLMDESTMHFWHAYHSQIYTTLRRLDADGLVISELDEGEDKLNKRVYTLTEAGHADLKVWLDTPLTEVVPAKEDLLLRLFFSADRDKSEVLDELRFQHQLHQRKLEHYLRMQRQPLAETPDSPDLPFWTATLDFGVEYERMYLNWLDHTIQTVEPLE